MRHCLGTGPSSSAHAETDVFLTCSQIGLFGATGILLKSLSYGSGVDLWNVSATHGALYTKV